LIVSKEGAVENAVVYISDIKKSKNMEPRKVTLDQKGCEYHPHVLAFPAGSTAEIVNPDGILHNIHSYSEKNEAFNIAQPKFKRTLTVRIDKPEIISLKCDVHGWMSGWFFVSENPYFSASDRAGKFKLSEVPPGEYAVEVWHEKLGKQSKKIQVKPGETVEVGFEFTETAS
jgi:plastocyanin